MKLKKVFPVLSIVILASAIRILYYFHYPGIWVQADTYGYYNIGKEILTGKFTQFFINDERTPIYPILLNLSAYFSGSLGVSIFSAGFFAAMGKIILLQSLFGIIGLLVLYKTLTMTGVSTIASYFYTLFTSFNILVFGWERILMTEGLSTFWLIIVLFMIVKILKKDKIIYFLFLLLIFIIGFLLKPFYVFLPVLIVPIIYYFRPSKTSLIGTAIVLLGFYLSVLGYVSRNKIVFDYIGVNKVSEINMLGKILQFNLSIESAKNTPYFYKAVREYRLEKGEPMPYRFLEQYNFYHNPELIKELETFNSIVIQSNFSDYFIKSTMQIPLAVTNVSELYILKQPRDGFLGYMFNNLALFYKNMQYSNLIGFSFFVAIFYVFFKHRTYKSAFISILGVISLYQILFSVFFSYGEFGRLISPGLPIIFLFSFYSYYLIFKKIIVLTYNKKRNKCKLSIPNLL